jgi:general nucleoside transport system permease protein
VPYYVSGVAVAIGFKMNLFNIGANGQYILAALIAAWAGAQVSLPAPLHVTFILAIADVGRGGLGVDRGDPQGDPQRQRGHLHDHAELHRTGSWRSCSPNSSARPGSGSLVAQTETLPPSAQLPALDPLIEWTGINFGNASLYGFLPFAIALGIGYHLLLNRSRFGYELRLSGVNPDAARSSGVNPKAMVAEDDHAVGRRRRLIGMHSLLADPQFHKYGDQFPKLLGFTGHLARAARPQPPCRHRRRRARLGMIERAPSRSAGSASPRRSA